MRTRERVRESRRRARPTGRGPLTAAQPTWLLIFAPAESFAWCGDRSRSLGPFTRTACEYIYGALDLFPGTCKMSLPPIWFGLHSQGGGKSCSSAGRLAPLNMCLQGKLRRQIAALVARFGACGFRTFGMEILRLRLESLLRWMMSSLAPLNSYIQFWIQKDVVISIEFWKHPCALLNCQITID